VVVLDLSVWLSRGSGFPCAAAAARASLDRGRAGRGRGACCGGAAISGRS